MSFGSYYPRLDKICDAPFVKTILGSTKKDAISIIQDCNLGAIFDETEKELSAMVNSIRQKIEDHMRSQAVKSAVFSYRQDLKKKTLVDKKEKEKKERDEIIRDYKKQVRERHTLVSVFNNEDQDDSDDDDDDKVPIDRMGPSMTLNQFAVLMKNAISDEAISFKIKQCDELSKPTLKIVNKQLQITVKIPIPVAQAEIPKLVDLEVEE